MWFDFTKAPSAEQIQKENFQFIIQETGQAYFAGIMVLALTARINFKRDFFRHSMATYRNSNIEFQISLMKNSRKASVFYPHQSFGNVLWSRLWERKTQCVGTLDELWRVFCLFFVLFKTFYWQPWH